MLDSGGEEQLVSLEARRELSSRCPSARGITVSLPRVNGHYQHILFDLPSVFVWSMFSECSEAEKTQISPSLDKLML